MLMTQMHVPACSLCWLSPTPLRAASRAAACYLRPRDRQRGVEYDPVKNSVGRTVNTRNKSKKRPLTCPGALEIVGCEPMVPACATCSTAGVSTGCSTVGAAAGDSSWTVGRWAGLAAGAPPDSLC